MTDLNLHIADYLRYRMSDVADIRIDELARIHGGSSQETFRFRASWNADGKREERSLILRRVPEAGLVDAEHDLEFTVYSALDNRCVPVPKVHYLELDPQWLGRPFFIMDLMPGKPGHFFASTDPYEGKGAEVGRNFWRHLGILAAQDHVELGLTGLRNGAATHGFWRQELDYWEARLDAGEAIVEPIVRAAIRWLRRNPPPEAAKPAISHGDYRCGNFLFTPDGSISAVLDWEMCHISDPLEDIAWGLNPMWSVDKHLPLEEGLAIWEKASGLMLDRAALDWWRLFATVKACGIWTTAEATFQEGTSGEMIVALTALRANHFHRKEMLDRMAAYGAMG